MKPNPRIHVTGAACAGVTTLGQRLSDLLALPLIDTDDYYWVATDPPYTTRRPIDERNRLIRAQMGAGGWILSGSVDGWGDRLVEDADLVVFLTAPTAVRLARLIAREHRRFGARIRPGGDMEKIHASFLDWASRYDDAGFTGRSRARHELWLSEQRAPVLRLGAQRPVDDLAKDVLARLAEIG
ncbi:MAG: adenylate kinase [Alphaproteobacteria bacterium]|nr:MAG: adenylate kinase [Alphaproteobacteria bacterium]